MQWTCQADGPLWWGIQRSEKWYTRETPEEELIDDYLRAHPQDRGKTLTLIWWVNWGTVGYQVWIGPRATAQHAVETVLM